MIMEQNSAQKNMWNTAGKAGLFLGLASTAYLFITQAIGQAELPAFLNSILGFVLWAAKFVGCIWIMKIFMKRYVSENPDSTNSDTFKLGTAMALLSAIVYSAAAFANVSFISADTIVEQTDLMIQLMAPMMDSNSLAQIDKVMEKLPQITFFSNLIYCFFYGTILSFIISRYIPSRNPFANNTSEEW